MELLKENDLLGSKEQRETLIDKIEVLEKVKDLILLPNSQVATMKQVAQYYKVSINTLKSVFYSNQEELLEDGCRLYKGSEINNAHMFNYKYVESNRANYMFLLDDETVLKVGGKGIILFTKRAILRIGMLLRDSDVAKEIRTRLLDIAHDAQNTITSNGNTITENIITELSEEKQLMLDRVEAEVNGDYDTVSVINAKLFALKNKRIKELEDKVKNITTSALTIQDSKNIINRLIRIIAIKKYNALFGEAWNMFYSKLNYKLEINIKKRAKKSNQSWLDTLDAEEISEAEKIAKSWAISLNIDIQEALHF